jgi:hypothetical protein
MRKPPLKKTNSATLKGNLTFQTKFSDEISTSILQYFNWFSEIIVHITLCVCHISKIGCSAFAIFPKIGCNNFFQILIRFSDLTLYIHTITHYESDSINNVEVNYDFL